MSQKEVDRLEIIQALAGKHLKQTEVAVKLGISTRQVRRLQARYEQEGPAGLISKSRGKPSNNRIKPETQEEIIALIKEKYSDFGPTFLREKLTEIHHYTISVESLRKLMIKASIWKGKSIKKIPVHQMRARREQRGELVQVDGSPHAWFEDRAPKCCLIVFIDDATSELMALHFAEQETTQAYFTALEQHINNHGRPLCLYSDRHGIFRINTSEAKGGTGETQLGRALRELDIQLICANSPQAKGRVERANSTLQDRLVKEMRLRGISDIESANAFLPEFIVDYNKRFAVKPENTTDAHRQKLPDSKTLALILCQQYERKISKNLEVSFLNVVYQIQTSTRSYAMRGAKVIVCDRSSKVTLIYKNKTLPYTTFKKKNKPAAVRSSKELDQCLNEAFSRTITERTWSAYPNEAEASNLSTGRGL